MKEWINKVTVALSVDYIVEQGTTSSWNYRKWKSGRIEAWYKGSATCSTTTAIGSVYRSTFSLAIGSGIFSAIPTKTFITIGDNTSTVISVQGDVTSTTNIDGRVFRATNTSSTYNLNLAVYVSYEV